jgi:hypothetical protein
MVGPHLGKEYLYTHVSAHTTPFPGQGELLPTFGSPAQPPDLSLAFHDPYVPWEEQPQTYHGMARNLSEWPTFPKGQTQAPKAWHTVGTLTTLNELNWTQPLSLKAWDGMAGGPQDNSGGGGSWTWHEITARKWLQFSPSPPGDVRKKASGWGWSVLNSSQTLCHYSFQVERRAPGLRWSATKSTQPARAHDHRAASTVYAFDGNRYWFFFEVMV